MSDSEVVGPDGGAQPERPEWDKRHLTEQLKRLREHPIMRVLSFFKLLAWAAGLARTAIEHEWKDTADAIMFWTKSLLNIISILFC